MGIPPTQRVGAATAGAGSQRLHSLTRAADLAAISGAALLRRILEFGLFAAVLIAVGGFGGTEPLPWGISESVILLLGLLLVIRVPATSARGHLTSSLRQGMALAVPKRTGHSGVLTPEVLTASNRSIWETGSSKYRKLAWFPAAMGAWVAVQWFASRKGRIGFDTHAIETQGLALATEIVAFFVALEIARERASRKRLALFLTGLGLFEAFYGLAQYLAGWQYIWNVPRRFYIGSATGTYVNHNHFAGLLEMILPLALGLSFYHWQSARRGSRRTWCSVLANLGDPEIVKCFLFLLAAAILLLAIVFSFSRMGMISMLVSLGVMSAVVWIGKKRSPLPAALILLLIAGGIAAAGWVGVGPVIEHFEQLSQNEPLAGGEGRMALWRDALALIRQHPWTGVGLGCFEYAFTRVRSVQLTYVADHAHNDYLEAAAELGIPCAAILFALFFWLAARMLQASLRARSNLARSLALGSLGGTSALLVHSVADFNLRIPANALVFAVILGLGYAMSLDANEAAAEITAPRSG